MRHNGQIKWQGRLRSIGEAFVGYPVALRAQPGGVYEVYFQRLLLGTLHDRDASGLLGDTAIVVKGDGGEIEINPDADSHLYGTTGGQSCWARLPKAR